MGRVTERLPRAMLRVVLVGVSFLAAGHTVPAAEAPVGGPPVTINYNNLLNGRYSFRLQGQSGCCLSGDNVPVSAIGSIVFDGQGNVESVKFFMTLAGFTFRFGRDADIWQFASGTYSVNNTEIGHVSLRFNDLFGHEDLGHRADERWKGVLHQRPQPGHCDGPGRGREHANDGRWPGNPGIARRRARRRVGPAATPKERMCVVCRGRATGRPGCAGFGGG
jgi:hypothetical protein